MKEKSIEEPQEENSFPIIIALILGIVFVTSSVFVEIACVRFFIETQKAANWPSTTCRILESRIESRFTGQFEYEAFISYEYQVDGKKYRGNDVRVGGESSRHQGEIQSLVNQFPYESQPTVYYHPDDHGKALLIVGPTFRNYVGILGPIFFFVIGISLIVTYFKEAFAVSDEEKASGGDPDAL